MAVDPTQTPMHSSNLSSIPLYRKGKVRDIYRIDEETLLFVATDRISSFDFLLDNVVPDKGKILTMLTKYWLTEVLPSLLPALRMHWVRSRSISAILSPEECRRVQGRAMVAEQVDMFPFEVIVRGFITGSAWAEYQAKGTVHGMPQPTGLVHGQQFPSGPLYTPAIKAAYGKHDENISQDRARTIVGEDNAARIEELALEIYRVAYA